MPPKKSHQHLMGVHPPEYIKDEVIELLAQPCGTISTKRRKTGLWPMVFAILDLHQSAVEEMQETCDECDPPYQRLAISRRACQQPDG